MLRPLEGLHDQPSFVLGRRNEVLASNALLDGLLTRFDHPLAGRLDITYEALTLPGDPDQVLFVYAGRTDTDLEKPRILASWSSEHSDPSVTNAAANQSPTATP